MASANSLVSCWPGWTVISVVVQWPVSFIRDWHLASEAVLHGGFEGGQFGFVPGSAALNLSILVSPGSATRPPVGA